MTHRGTAAGFTVVTGHRRDGEPDVDWRTLAAFSATSGSTIVVLMGVATRAAIAAELLAGGLAPSTPVAAVHAATTGDQDTIRGRLAHLGTMDVRSPATIVIGPVAAMALTTRPNAQPDRVAVPMS